MPHIAITTEVNTASPRMIQVIIPLLATHPTEKLENMLRARLSRDR